ncbi:MAG: hypothetical protein ABIJ59_02195 [Pseudomonadota bacterium]
MLEIRMLPARQGDAIWIKWGKNSLKYQMMVDMGTTQVGTNIQEQLKHAGKEASEFELLVISHVDGDHIGGVLSCLADEDPHVNIDFKDIWFNGWVHLDGGRVQGPHALTAGSSGAANDLESFGPVQGELFSRWLGNRNWNKAFNTGPVCRVPGSDLPRITLSDGLQLTILGPSPARLSKFKPKWKKEVQKAIKKGTLDQVSPGLEAFGSTDPPILETQEDLEILAQTLNVNDSSEANGSSIILLLEYENHRILLAGDAFADDIIEGLSLLDNGNKVRLDVFKIPHHGSKKNLTQEMVEQVSCKNWIFSTDGTQFRHPDSEAIARVVAYSSKSPVNLIFNVESTFNKWWDNPDWQRMYHYSAAYGKDEDGIQITF